jgi:tRNA-2-methylthio-N6-dimethylallyladenosine synthase
MNEYDSERTAFILERRGLAPAEDILKADLVVINTCSVRAKPQHKVVSLLGKLRKIDTENRIKIGVIGCFAQQLGAKILKNHPNADFVLGTDQVDKLDEALERVSKGERVAFTETEYEQFTIKNFRRKPLVSVYVSVMKGCNNYCSYCIVPYVRGREVSRSQSEIIAEISELVQFGTREVTLIGQNVNSYGRSAVCKSAFPDILLKVAEIDGIRRVRFVTSHPKDFSSEMAKAIAANTKIAPMIHMPLQSASDSILKAMNRGYALSEYRDKIAMAEEIIPNVRFSSDFIVGFPGETLEDFEMTYAAIEEFDYESSFVFCYSPRPNTEAAELVDDVPFDEKCGRLKKLVALQDSLTERHYRHLIGNVFPVLADGFSKWDKNMLTGRTIHNRIMNFTSKNAINAGEIAEVRLTEVKRNTLLGEVI